MDTLKRVEGVGRFVACEPPESCEELRARAGASIDVISQRDGDLGSRMHGVAEDVFRLGAAGVILIGSDPPDLPPQVIADAAHALNRCGDRIVLGPAGDGGYYLLGLKAPHPESFEGIDWSTSAVFDQTLARARGAGLDVQLAPPWRDIDVWDDLLRLRAADTLGAARARAWLRKAKNES